MKKLGKALTGRFGHRGRRPRRIPRPTTGSTPSTSASWKEGCPSDSEHQAGHCRCCALSRRPWRAGKTTSLADYVKRMPSEQTEIYYLQFARDRAVGLRRART